MKPTRLRARRCLAVAVLLLAAPGCEDTATRPAWIVHQRLANLDRASTPTLATVGGESRPVLQGFTRHEMRSVDITLEPGEKPNQILIGVPVPTTLSRGNRVVAGVRSRNRDGAAWSSSDGRMLTTDRQRVVFPLQVANEAAAGPAGRSGGVDAFEVRVELLRPSSPDPIESEELDVPAAASLDVGFGVLDVAWGQGPVSFHVEVCRDGRCETLHREKLDPALEADRGWRDRSISLAALAGRRVSFRFATEPERSGPESFTFPAWSSPRVVVAAGEAPLNLILISLDTLRADHLPTYGYSRDTAPFIEERFARHGTVFEQAMSAASTTGPSHMSMFTSLLPSVHHVISNEGRASLAPEITTLAQALAAHGFSTGAVTENGAIMLGRGFERGFDSYTENPTHADGATEGAGKTFALGRRWLERNADRRFFLFLHTYEVHTPYEPPDPYGELGWDPIPGSPKLPKKWDPDRYDLEIVYTDDALRELFGWLEASGLLDRTLIVVTSDHGEAFLEHGYLAHGSGLHQEILHVPLIFLGPGVPAGERISTPVSLIDLMPTLLDLMEVPAVPGGMGRSAAGLVRGEEPDAAWRTRPLYAESWRRARVKKADRGHFLGVPIDWPGFAVRVGDAKMIRRGQTFEFFDLADDPAEQENLVRQRADAARPLQRLLEDYEAQTAALREGLESADGVLSDEQTEALRALGYIE